MSTVLPRPPKVEMDFTDAQLTGFGGWSVLGQMADRLDLPRALSAVSVKVAVPVPVQVLVGVPGVLPRSLGRVGLRLSRGLGLHDGGRGRRPRHGFDHDGLLARRRVRPAFVLLACLLLGRAVALANLQ